MSSVFFIVPSITVVYALETGDGINVATNINVNKLSRHEALFLTHVAESANAEAMASALVQSKTLDPEVKQYAALMVENQQSMRDELRQLALKNRIELPATPSKLQQQALTKLSKLEGMRFDREYCRQIAVLEHKDSLAIFKQAVKRAKNPDVLAFANKHLANIEANLQMGEALKMAVDKKVRPLRKSSITPITPPIKIVE
ncbi:MAG: DUF4142 domain-containing protein [Glaciimonas sp.]|nr:DUF4142 domain-containing protein [Glaciimonas sp.]